MAQEQEKRQAEKARAQAEEEELKRIEDEDKRRTTRRPPMDINKRTRFRPVERQLLHDWIKDQRDKHTSPRTVRTLITRYLLARLMISTFGFDPDAQSLISALSGKPIEARMEPDEFRAYNRVAIALAQP